MGKTKKTATGKKKFNLKNMSDTNLLLMITVIVFFLMYIGAILFQGGGFLKPQTFFNILNANAALLIASCGLSIVMITGSIDISVGGVAALVSMCCAVYLDYKGGNVFVSLLIALGIGLAFGLVQGYLIAYLDIQPFIVSLAGMFFARGMTTIVQRISQICNNCRKMLAGIPDTVWICAMLCKQPSCSTGNSGFL